MTYDFRRRLRSPRPGEERPSRRDVSQDTFDAWWEHNDGTILSPADDGQLNVSNDFGRIVAAALLQAGAARDARRRACCSPVRSPPCSHVRRAPDGRVSLLKFYSHEGWFVEPSEALFLAEHLDSLLDKAPVLEVEEVDHGAYRPDMAPEDVPLVIRRYDLSLESHERYLQALREFATFCRGSVGFGFEVW